MCAKTQLAPVEIQNQNYPCKTLPVNVDNEVQEDGCVDKQHDADGEVKPDKLVKITIKEATPVRSKFILNHKMMTCFVRDLPVTKPRFVNCTIWCKHFYKACCQA